MLLFNLGFLLLLIGNYLVIWSLDTPLLVKFNKFLASIVLTLIDVLILLFIDMLKIQRL